MSPDREVTGPAQLSALDVFQNAIAQFVAKMTTSNGGGGGIMAGPRIDPEGAPAATSGGTSTVGTP